MNCSSNVCPDPVSMFRCKNGRCIMAIWHCDGDMDCIDGEDEPDDVCSQRTCDPTYFKCRNNKLIIF